MKTRFYINYEIFLGNGSLEECYMYYYKNYEAIGYILDKDEQDVYLEVDAYFDLSEGDLVFLHDHAVVDFKRTHVLENHVRYYLKEE